MQEAHVAKLSGNLDSAGDASLQNGLDTSIGALKAIPPYGHREASSPLAGSRLTDFGHAAKASYQELAHQAAMSL